MSGYNKKYDVSTCNSQRVGIGLRSETIMNIYDIAKLSGVSIATVSRVINNSPKVSEKTKKKVWDVMNEYDYTPNVFARGLGLNSVKTVGLVCPDVSDRYMANAIAYLEKNLRKYGYDSILMCSGFDYEGKVEAVKILLDRRIDAMILVGSHYAGDCGQNDIQYLQDAAQKVPVVLMNGYIRVPGVYCVLTDNYKAVYDTVCNLIEAGRKKIVFLYDANSYSTTKKLEGYQDALIDNGLKVQEEYKVLMPNNVLKARDLLAKKKLDFDAVIASDDAMAVGALKYVHQINKSIPEDVNVVGFNNSELCVCCYPEMSSIDSQEEELSEIAVDCLLKFLRENQFDKKWRFHVNLLSEIQHSSNIRRITVKLIKKRLFRRKSLFLSPRSLISGVPSYGIKLSLA